MIRIFVAVYTVWLNSLTFVQRVVFLLAELRKCVAVV